MAKMSWMAEIATLVARYSSLDGQAGSFAGGRAPKRSRQAMRSIRALLAVRLSPETTSGPRSDAMPPVLPRPTNTVG